MPIPKPILIIFLMPIFRPKAIILFVVKLGRKQKVYPKKVKKYREYFFCFDDILDTAFFTGYFSCFQIGSVKLLRWERAETVWKTLMIYILLNVSSNLFQQNAQIFLPPINIQSSIKVFTNDYRKLQTSEGNALVYITGYLLKKALAQHSCQICQE